MVLSEHYCTKTAECGTLSHIIQPDDMSPTLGHKTIRQWSWLARLKPMECDRKQTPRRCFGIKTAFTASVIKPIIILVVIAVTRKWGESNANTDDINTNCANTEHTTLAALSTAEPRAYLSTLTGLSRQGGLH